MKDQTLQRVEVELDRARYEWERAKMAADKADGTRQMQENQIEKLQREIESWREKHNKAINDVDEAEIRFDQIETENARLRFQLQEVGCSF